MGNSPSFSVVTIAVRVGDFHFHPRQESVSASVEKYAQVSARVPDVSFDTGKAKNEDVSVDP